MSARLAVFAALAAVAIWLVWPGSPEPSTQAQSRQPAPVSQFSPWYAEALRDILDLEETDIPPLERRLAANPNDFPARLKLMAYHLRADRVANPEDRVKRLSHVLWLIEHHPDSELLRSYVSRLTRDEMTQEDYQRAVALWDAAMQARPDELAVQ